MNILLVEDDQSSRRQIGKILRELGHHVAESDNGVDALVLFKAGEFHMVLSDIRMPGMSGIELLRKLSYLPAGREADVVLFTGYGDMESAIEALRAGAYDYMLKPINVEELAVVTGRVAEHQALRRENRILTENFDGEVKAAIEETERELSSLKKAYAMIVGPGEIGIFSDCIRDILAQADKFHSDRSIPVLIQGETGTGKEVIARYVHFGRSVVTAPFVDINCAALTPGIFESELFGYEAGSFTGGLPKGQRGKLDVARGGTIFLDEVTELPLDLQAKLLRVIQEKEYYRVGGLKKIKADVRIICTTNLNIGKCVDEGSFRKDLYYRLCVGRLYLPPLRERAEEILPLGEMFLKKMAGSKGKKFIKISNPAAEILLSYEWPGNIRELRNTMEWVTLMYDDVELKPEHLGVLEQSKTRPLQAGSGHCRILDPVNFSLPAEGLNIEGYFDRIIGRALEMHGGNKTKTAGYLGISRRSLQCRLARIRKKSL
jgi:DNA-binding NtrC family response regulator